MRSGRFFVVFAVLAVLAAVSSPAQAQNVVQNPGFETGVLAPSWIVDGFNNAPVVDMNFPHSGTFSALAGNDSGPEPGGDSSFYQTVTVPPAFTVPHLTFWRKLFTTDSITFDWQDAYIQDNSGTTLATLFHLCITQPYTLIDVDMTPYAGQTVRIKFLAHQDAFGDDTSMRIDDVSLAPTIVFTKGDFNGDGKTDILFRHNFAGKNVVWYMDGITRTAGVFTNPDTLADTNWQIRGTNDFNGDNKTDILFQHFVSGKNVVWYMDGITRTAGVFTNPSVIPDTDWRIVGTGEFSSPPDGKPDILFRHEISGKNVVWYMDGITRTAGVFTNPDSLADTHWMMVGVGDFWSAAGGQDGKSDILWRHTVSGKNVLWYMDGITRTMGTFTNPDTLPDTHWTMVGVGDFSKPSDGRPDILFRHEVSGKNVVWYMNGATRTGGVYTNPDVLADTNWRIVGPR